MKARFAGFVLDRVARRLVRNGEDVHLSPKAFDLLVLLVERRPAVVEKAALREHLWPGVHVVDASLSNLVTEIRGALGDRVAETPIVRTVHGVGYAFASELVEEPARGPAATQCVVVYQDRPITLAVGEHLVGRDPACTVWIDSGDVSRRHARIRVAGEKTTLEVTIEDLASTNGTFVVGKRIDGPVRLSHGDRIRVGRETLDFRAPNGADTPTRRVRAGKKRT